VNGLDRRTASSPVTALRPLWQAAAPVYSDEAMFAAHAATHVYRQGFAHGADPPRARARAHAVDPSTDATGGGDFTRAAPPLALRSEHSSRGCCAGTRSRPGRRTWAAAALGGGEHARKPGPHAAASRRGLLDLEHDAQAACGRSGTEVGACESRILLARADSMVESGSRPTGSDRHGPAILPARPRQARGAADGDAAGGRVGAALAATCAVNGAAALHHWPLRLVRPAAKTTRWRPQQNA
jgi:hypothetical protein